ncbi:MAG: acetolactate synthase small subunit [Spirochaetales bacterium]|nr:acetolactate synthase small subunit [Spirochaetales bacterium]
MNSDNGYTDHIVAVLVHNNPGVLSKVTSLVTRRGFNIDSISAGPTRQNDMFRLTIVVKGDDRSIEQIQKQLYKIIDVVKVVPINKNRMAGREICLIKVKASGKERHEMLQIISVFKANVVDVGTNGFIVEITGDSDKIDSFLALLEPHQIIDVARTGIVAMNRWDNPYN